MSSGACPRGLWTATVSSHKDTCRSGPGPILTTPFEGPGTPRGAGWGGDRAPASRAAVAFPGRRSRCGELRKKQGPWFSAPFPLRRYWANLKLWFKQKISKEEFDLEAHRLLTQDNGKQRPGASLPVPQGSQSCEKLKSFHLKK